MRSLSFRQRFLRTICLSASRSILGPLYPILYPRSSILHPPSSILHPRSSFAVLLLALVLTVGCRQDMHDQPKYRPLRPVDSFGAIKDERSARPLVEGTVARDQLREDVEFYTGKVAGAASTAAPQPAAAGLARRRDGRGQRPRARGRLV